MAKHGSKPKRKKKYVPKGFDVNAMFHAIRANWRASATAANDGTNVAALRKRFSQPVGEQQQQELHEEYRAALVAMRVGNGDTDDYSMVATALNTGLVLCERGFGEEYLGTFKTALDTLAQAHANYEATGKWEWSEEGNEAMNDAIDVHAAQVEHALQADMNSAFAEVAKRIEAAIATAKELQAA